MKEGIVSNDGSDGSRAIAPETRSSSNNNNNSSITNNGPPPGMRVTSNSLTNLILLDPEEDGHRWHRCPIIQDLPPTEVLITPSAMAAHIATYDNVESSSNDTASHTSGRCHGHNLYLDGENDIRNWLFPSPMPPSLHNVDGVIRILQEVEDILNQDEEMFHLWDNNHQ